GFVVEKDGAHKNEFDLKARALMPLVDAARMLALKGGRIDLVSTTARLQWAASEHARHAPLLRSTAKAFTRLLTYRARASRDQHSSGRFLRPDTLDPYDRQVLKQCFPPIEELQQVIRVQFGTNLLPS
ncbi:putative nucleotidyltransferase substrate binding domain-containing protein, partial [Arthrospira platensis SPKY1]|nr:putative nucleotidyltransferase substrate binding domain-containing protein [Arthrospira platensis SPKY1]